jgi:DNA-binding NtrC family response regulator
MKTVLIVDDERKICEMLSQFFTLKGFRAQTAQSGRDAMAQLERQRPDYLLLDIRMPDMSGLDVLRQVKARYPDLRVVMVSAHDDPEIVDEAFREGAADYVTKPIAFSDQAWARAFFSPT